MTDAKKVLKKGELLGIAISLAVEAHEGQFDKGGNPYILHPLKVMHYMNTDDELEQACAVLHDAVEDNKKFTWEYLRSKHIPEECITTLKLLTKVPGQTEEEYQVGVLSEVRAMRVKKRDLRHNSDIRRMKNREITEKDIERITKYMKFHARIEARLHELGTK